MTTRTNTARFVSALREGNRPEAERLLCDARGMDLEWDLALSLEDEIEALERDGYRVRWDGRDGGLVTIWP